MLGAIALPQPEPGTRPDHILFLRLDRREAGDRDVGLHRHWLDPTVPFAVTLAAPAHGVLVTSATLRDSGEAETEVAWSAAEQRAGAPHLPSPAIRAAVASPFDYAAQTRAFVVTDVAAGDLAALSAAYRTLFLAAGGGGLGLFTAIRRLREVHARIAPALEAAGIPLLAQHVDAMDNATLIDIFRTEEESCLLGTDAMRDGVDVPGRALRLVVFERVPWPRPDILHRERRIHLSGGDPKAFDDRIARLRLRQAFGRLIRRATDRGVFVLLDRQTPTRLLSAFPTGVVVQRVRAGGGCGRDARLPAPRSVRGAVLLTGAHSLRIRLHVEDENAQMLARTGLDPQEALICTMVLVAAADGGMSDREIGVMAGQVQTLPIFHDFSSERLESATDAAVNLLNEEDGLSHAGRLIREALEPRLRETAYALACEVIAADLVHGQQSLQMLELVMNELDLDPLVAAAIERGVRARHQRS